MFLLFVSDNVNECYHTTVEYDPCISNESFKNRGCKYRTLLKDYKVIREQQMKIYSLIMIPRITPYEQLNFIKENISQTNVRDTKRRSYCGTYNTTTLNKM